MRKKFSHFSLMASIGIFAFGAVGIASCGSLIQPAAVKLSASELELAVGETVELKATLSKGYDGELKWFSSNENYVIVKSGFVFGVGVGNATVTAAYNGGYAECKVTVVDNGGGGGGGGETKVDFLTVNPSSKKVTEGDTFLISYTAYPEDTTVTYSSRSEAVATVGQDGTVTAVAPGTTQIVATGSNNKVASCTVEVVSKDQPVIRDIGVDSKDFGISGVSLRVGAPKDQVAWMNGIVSEFNTLTNSTISFTVSEFEEGDGVSNLPTAASAPDIFPYASDQTLSFYQLGALATVSKSDSNWIKNNMGDAALDAAKLNGVVGYPFTSDNGSVLFYDKTLITDPAQIETVDALYARADELGYDLDIGYGNTFLGAGYLQSFAGGKSFYSLTPTNTSYKSTSSFNSPAGLKGAKYLYDLISRDATRNSARTPGEKNSVLATIIDVSKVKTLKAEMGANYATAPLPFVDAEKTTRLGSYLGYKFYGINNTLDKNNQAAASCVARFLCSEYVQYKRYEEFKARPTITKLQDMAAAESHIASLVEQSKNNGTIMLSACGLELWSEVGTAITSIKTYATAGKEPTDAQLTEILKVLDAALTK